MRRFNYSEVGPTADLTVEAVGDTLNEAFENVGKAMFNAMTPIEGIEERISRRFEVSGCDLGSLLFNFLDELLYIHETELLIFSSFEIDLNMENNSLKAECKGEKFNLQRHEQGIAIKAVTFHNMTIEEEESGWAVRVVLDT